MVQKIATLAPAAGGVLANLLGAKYPGTGHSVEAQVKEAIATIGENMGVRRTAALTVKDGIVADYIHNKAAEGLGKIGVIVALEGVGDNAKMTQFGKQLAMHIAASNPLAVTAADLDKAAIEKERAFYIEQAAQSGKPKDIIEKMVEGRLKKEFFQQVCLMSQVFVLDGKASVEEVLKGVEKEAGAPIKVTGFVRYALGEGIEKKQEDFAAEVAKTVGAAAPSAPAPAKAAEAPKAAAKTAAAPKSGGGVKAPKPKKK
jgi:elongation factor Ts